MHVFLTEQETGSAWQNKRMLVPNSNIDPAIYDYDDDGLALEYGDGEDHRLQKRSPLILLPKVLLLKKLLAINKISPVPIG